MGNKPICRSTVPQECLCTHTRKSTSLPPAGKPAGGTLSKKCLLSLIFGRECYPFARATLRSRVQVLASKTPLCWAAQDIILELALEQPGRIQKGTRTGNNQLCWKMLAVANKDISESKLTTKPERANKVGNTRLKVWLMWALRKKEIGERERKQQGRAWSDVACQGSISADLWARKLPVAVCSYDVHRNKLFCASLVNKPG